MIEPKISLNTNYLYLQKLILSSLILDLLWRPLASKEDEGCDQRSSLILDLLWSAPWLPRWHPLWLQHPLRLLWPEAKTFLRQIWWFGENYQYALQY